MRLVNRLVMALTAIAVMTPVAAAATTSTVPLEYSADGRTWQSTPVPLFSPEFRPVPGSTTTATTYVRSTHAQAANLAIFVDHAASSSHALLEATTISGEEASAQQLASLDRCAPLRSTRIVPGGTVPVTVTLSAAPALSEAQLTPLHVRVTAVMSDTVVAPQPTGCGGDRVDVESGLAVTGNDVGATWPALVVSAIAVCFGLLLVGRRDRRMPA